MRKDMLDYSSAVKSHHIADVLGPQYYAFAFEGTAPTSVEEIPFELLRDSSTISNFPIVGYKTFNWVNIYNNMVQANFVTASRPTKDSVAFNQREVSTNRPKLGYLDTSKSKFRHIPQKVSTNLEDHDNNAIVSESANHIPMPFAFQPGLAEFSSLASWYMNIPKEATGLWLECDFEKVVPIDRIDFSGNDSNHLEGITEIQQWDSTLNEGSGDWVTFTTIDLKQNSNNIIEFTEVQTSKIRFNFVQGSQTTLNTRITEIAFYGADPETLDSPKTIGWMLLIPCTIRNDHTYLSVSPECPYIISAAGGPLDPREAIFSSEVPTAGRLNSLLSFEFKFVAKESF